MAKLEDQLDELLAFAADVGRIGAEAVSASHLSHVRNDSRTREKARHAAVCAETAEKLLLVARAKFLALRERGEG